MIETYASAVKRNQAYAYDLFDSPHAERVKSLVKIPETEAAERKLAALLTGIEDAKIRAAIDEAVGQFSRAYEQLGFIEGMLAERSYACIL